MKQISYVLYICAAIHEIRIANSGVKIKLKFFIFDLLSSFCTCNNKSENQK